MKKGDKVIKDGTTKPVMIVFGITAVGNFPKYKQAEDLVTCDYKDEAGIKVRKNFKISELKVVPNSK